MIVTNLNQPMAVENIRFPPLHLKVYSAIIIRHKYEPYMNEPLHMRCLTHMTKTPKSLVTRDL